MKQVPLKRMKLARLVPADYNPRTITAERLADLGGSLEHFGDVQVLVYNKRLKRLVAGHQRVKALLDLGETEADVKVVDLDEADEKRLNVRLNTASGEWDNERLLVTLTELKAVDVDAFAYTGWTLEGLAELDVAKELKESGGQYVDDIDYDGEKVCSVGDTWILGRHRVVVGDAFDPEARTRMVGSDKVSLMFSDPPYGVDVLGGKRGVRAAERDGFASGSADAALGQGLRTHRSANGYPARFAQALTKPVAPQRRGLGRSGGLGAVTATLRSKTPSYVKGSEQDQPGSTPNSRLVLPRAYQPVHGDDQPFDPTPFLDLAPVSILFGGNCYAHRLPPSPHWLVWDKHGANHNEDALSFGDCELMWTNVKNRISVKVYRHHWTGMLREGNRKDEGIKRVHPTQKPVGMLAAIIQDYSKDGAVVCDPFLGSGSTLIACEVSGRTCVGMEIMPHYADVVAARWAKHSCKPAVLVKPNGARREVPF